MPLIHRLWETSYLNGSVDWENRIAELASCQPTTLKTSSSSRLSTIPERDSRYRGSWEGNLLVKNQGEKVEQQYYFPSTGGRVRRQSILGKLAFQSQTPQSTPWELKPLAGFPSSVSHEN